MIGRYVSDLDVGDQLGPVEREITSFLTREYAHGVEETSARHQGVAGQVAPPTLFHAHKLCLLHHACPDGAGPAARMHVSYRAQHHEAIPVGARVSISGLITNRYQRNGREYLDMTIDIVDSDSGRAYATYVDTTLLKYRSDEG